MPLIELQCKDCRKVVKKLVKAREKSGSFTCSCGGVAERKLSVFGVKLEGPGFRHTDHASFDRRVGADAEAKWNIYSRNWYEKRQLSKENPGKDIVKDMSGGYSVQEP